MLQPGEEQQIRSGNWQLDCTRITLRQRSSQNPRIYVGPGWIRHDSEGELTFKLVTALGFDALVDQMNQAPGKLVPEERY